ncbi:MAG: hypothetical protein M1541_10670, partial [Acidobacteria bacterium]|nr:hypothetical protein [Acidobacteriota bacterium]
RGEWTERAHTALPAADVEIDSPQPALKYLHRKLKGGDLYFFFNEGAEKVQVTARLAGFGRPQIWDAESGSMFVVGSARQERGHIRLPLVLEPHETVFVVLGPARPGLPEAPRLGRAGETVELGGAWALSVAGRKLTTRLVPWARFGLSGYTGTGTYRKEFDRSAGTESGRLFLDLGEVRYSARVRLNGRDLGARAWRPFRWDITDAIRPGPNTLEIEIANTPANELSGNPERRKEVEAKGWLRNSYIGTYEKFDAEMVPSGLLGPVRLVPYEGKR